MTTRVLSSNEAKEAIITMKSIIDGGLQETLARLNTEGTKLSDPNIWDGQLAANFRGELWPSTKTALDNMKIQLEELRTNIDAINVDIMRAGGNSV